MNSTVSSNVQQRSLRISNLESEAPANRSARKNPSLKAGVFFGLNKDRKEIEARIRRRYLDRLSDRVKRIRRLLVERNWEKLRSECEHLAVTGDTFGFRDLTDLAIETHSMIPAGRIPRASTPLQAKQRAESLIAAMDALLVERELN